jgi:hypothetical protein
MCGCTSVVSKIPAQQAVPVAVYVPNPNCSYDLTDAFNTRLRLQCLQSKVKIATYNKYLGVVNSLINLQDYCRYDLTPIIAVLDENGC